MRIREALGLVAAIGLVGCGSAHSASGGPVGQANVSTPGVSTAHGGSAPAITRAAASASTARVHAATAPSAAPAPSAATAAPATSSATAGIPAALATAARASARTSGRLTVATTILPDAALRLATTRSAVTIAQTRGALTLADPNAILAHRALTGPVRIIAGASNSGSGSGTGSGTGSGLVVNNALTLGGGPAPLGVVQPAPPPAWASRHDMSADEWQAQVEALDAQGFRPVNVSVAGSTDDPRFTATFVQDGLAWAARHGLTADDYQQAVDSFWAQGLRVLSVAVYGTYPDERYAAVWVQDGATWTARHRLTADEYQQAFTDLTNQGYRPAWVSASGSGSDARFAAVFVQDGLAYAGVHERSLDDLRASLRDLSGQGYRLVSLARYGSFYDTRYAAAWVKDGRDFLTFEDLTSDEYQTTTDKLAPDGYRPEFAAETGPCNLPLFTSSWVRDPGSFVFTKTGQDVPELAGIDQAIQDYMTANGVTAGSIAVTKNGRLVLNRGYTCGPVSMELTQPDSLFRMASVSKSLTSAGILHLVAQGQLDVKTPLAQLFPTLAIPFVTQDSRFASVTIENLLQHRGGWNRDKNPGGYDPMFLDRTVSSFFGMPLPTNPSEIFTYMQMARSLDVDPGKETHYSNFGYSLLGRVIERVTGRSYEEYMRDEVLSRVGAQGMRLGKARFTDRQAGEVLYECTSHDRDVMGTDRVVPVQYGGWNIEAMDSHGEWVASTKDYARFLSSFDDIDTNPILTHDLIQEMWTPPAGEAIAMGWIQDGQIMWHNGILDGTWAQMERHADGVCFVAFFNKRAGDSFVGPVRQAIANVTTWPTHDLFN